MNAVRRSILTTLVAVLGVLAFAVAPALASTPEAPEVEEPSVSDVAATSATFRAAVNPEGAATSYVFEAAPAGGAFAPIVEAQGSGSLPEGAAGVPVSAHVQGLTADTAYQFRVIATNSVKTTTSAVVSFTTQRAGGGLMLLDGRQWELVSPPNKHGAVLFSLSNENQVLQAAADGSGISYAANVPTEQGAAGYAAAEQIFSQRGPEGWASRDISPLHKSFAGVPAEFDSEYFVFNSDLSAALVFPEAEDIYEGEESTLLSDEASEPTPYIRRESLCDGPTTASECYRPVLTGKEGFADVPSGTVLGPEKGGGRTAAIAGVTPDMSHVVVQSPLQLTATPPNPFSENYEWSADAPPAESLQMVTILPESEGGGPAREATVGELHQNPPGGAEHAISNSGARIFWEATNLESGLLVYVRDTVKKETLRLDVPESGMPSGHAPEARFRIANSEGSRVFFTDSDVDERLTPTSGSQGLDLYECRIVEEAGKLKCDLTDLSPATNGQSAEAEGVLGASEDGTYVYFAASGVLGDGAARGATQGPNLYEYHEGVTTFIASLHGEEQPEVNWLQAAKRESRVSPDGRYLAFVSNRSLTGYDTRDVASGKPDREVYLYDSASGRLACVSCDPSGARPNGVEAGKVGGGDLADIPRGAGSSREQWIAANLPGAPDIASEEWLYQPRALSDSGRVFFNSSDALVPQDVNGQEDVYEFEPQGVGNCTSATPTFDAKTDGCVDLISAGTSPEESGFLDASESGGDVFFVTSSQLTAQDFDTAEDVYDAHECSTSVPCTPLPVAPPPCDTGDSCKAAPAPQPSIYGAPASATFNGAGNVVSTAPEPRAKPKKAVKCKRGAVRKHGRCVKSPKKKRKAHGKSTRSSERKGR
jgi:hypothetical protein